MVDCRLTVGSPSGDRRYNPLSDRRNAVSYPISISAMGAFKSLIEAFLVR